MMEVDEYNNTFRGVTLGGFGGSLTLLTMKVSCSCRANLGAAGQVLATRWVIFIILR